MSIRLRELIKAVRTCKTAAEERDVVAKESAALREAFRDQDQKYRHRNVAKLMYIHMLGYPTHFGQMETLKLIAANGFPEKRIGYLGLMILLDERQEVLMLVTNSLKMDLNHKNQYIVGLALAALGNICSAEMARDLAPDVEKLIDSANAYVRKKAALCAIRIVKKVPDLIESFMDKAVDLVMDKNHGVMLGGATLMLAICEQEPAAIESYRRHVSVLCRVLKSLLQSGFSPEHDVGGITDPFLQVKLLRLLRLLGQNDAEASDTMSDILAQVASNIDSGRNAGNAILYECVQTIMGIEAIGGLRVLAVNILGRFLSNRDNNIRYVALNTLAKVVSVDTQAVQRHRTTIVDCVKDADVSIRRRALELVYSLVNENNIRTLTKELLDYLAVSDSEFKPDLTTKICSLIQRFAPDKRWHIDNLFAVMVQAGAYVKEEVVRAMIVLVTNAPTLHAYAVRSAYRNLLQHQDEGASTSLHVACIWLLGEYSELLLPGAAGSALLEGEAPLNATDSDVVSLLESVAKGFKTPCEVKQYALTALMKLTARLPNQVARIKALVEKQKTSILLEVQARSCEYSQIFKHEKLRPQLLERMPVPAEDDGAGDAAAASGAAAGLPAVSAAPAQPKDDLLDLLGPAETPAPSASAAAIDPLEQLLGPTVPTPAAAPIAGAVSGGAADLLDLLAAPAPTPAPAPAPVAAYQQLDPLANLLGSTPVPPAAAAAVAAPIPASLFDPAPAFPPVTAYQNNGITGTFSFTKSADQPALTTITATYSNSSYNHVTDFLVQVATPKYMQARLEPASGTTLPPITPMGAIPITQLIRVTNNMHGQKPLALRLRLSYSLNGQPVVEQAEVSNLPLGL